MIFEESHLTHFAVNQRVMVYWNHLVIQFKVWLQLSKLPVYSFIEGI